MVNHPADNPSPPQHLNRAQRRARMRDQGLLPTHPPQPVPVPAPDPPVTPLESRPKLLEYLIVRMGVPLGIVGVGVGLMTAAYFYAGIFLLYLGLLLVAVDIAFEKFFVKWPAGLKALSGIVYVLAIAAASYFWIFTSAPLSVFANSSVDVYGPGTELHGIKWLPRYSELTVEIGNDSSTDYDNFDAELSTDLVINHLVQTEGLGECKLEGIHGAMEPAHWQHMENGKPVGSIDDPKWEYQTVPFDKNGNAIVPFNGADWTFRIRCDKIPAKSRISLFGALVVLDPRASHCIAPCSYSFFAPPQPARKVVIAAKFQTAGRNRTKVEFSCATGSQCQVP
jgi:hypothetical protein